MRRIIGSPEIANFAGFPSDITGSSPTRRHFSMSSETAIPIVSRHTPFCLAL